MFNDKLPSGVSDFREEFDAPRTQVRTKKRQRTFTLSDEALAGLQYLARMHNESESYGHQNSTSNFLERIGNFELTVVDPKTITRPANVRAFEELKERLLGKQENG